MYQQTIEPLSPWGNHENQPQKFFVNQQPIHKKSKLMRAMSGSILSHRKNDLFGVTNDLYKPQTASKKREKTRVQSIINKRKTESTNSNIKSYKNSEVSYAKEKSLSYKCQNIKNQTIKQHYCHKIINNDTNEFNNDQFDVNASEYIPISYRLKALGKAPNRIFNKKKSEQNVIKYSSPRSNGTGIPKTSSVRKRLNSIFRKGNQQKFEMFMKLETYRSKLFDHQIRSHRNLNASQKQQRGTMLSKYSHKIIMTFKPSQKGQTINTFLINNRKVSIVKNQDKHLLDRLLLKYQ